MSHRITVGEELRYDTDLQAVRTLSGTYAGKTLKRSTLVLGDANNAVGASAFDYVQRVWFMLPFGVTRYRFRVANRNTASMAALTTPVTITGIAIGTPAIAATGRWTGSFSATPTTVVNGNQTVPTDGTDYTSPWITAPAISAGTPVMVSMGWTSTNTGTGLTVVSSMQCYAASVAGSAAAFASLTPGSMTVGNARWATDTRIEYEFYANPQTLIGLFLGDSITGGYGDGDATATQKASLPHEAWPGAAAMLTGGSWINRGESGSGANGTWNNNTASLMTRVDLTTSVPDYAVISIGANDVTAAVSLGAYQAAVANMVTAVKAAGINRILLGTILPASYTNESLRTSYNAWLRQVPLGCQGVLDFDLLLRTPATVTAMLAEFASADGQHPLRGGYQAMARLARISA